MVSDQFIANPDLTAITKRQQATWRAGDFSAIGGLHQIVSETLCEAVDLHAGNAVLDVACGAGNSAIAAGRRFCEVTGLDYVPDLLERARERAGVERIPVQFDEGDAAHLPYPDASFDVVLSTFGSMFSPDQEGTASEMVRVCRPGGTIGMANWTPDGWVGTMFRIITGFVPQPPGILPPTRWGTEAGLHELFGDAVRDVRIARRNFTFRFRSPEHWLGYFRVNLGPMVTAFAVLDAADQQRLTDELLRGVSSINRATDGTLIASTDYLEVVFTRV